MDGRVLLLIGSVALTGCAGEPMEPPPVARDTIPPPPIANADLFYDTFDVDPRESGAWRIGYPDRRANVDGAGSWAPGSIRIAIPATTRGGEPPVYGFMRAVELSDDGGVLDARVRAHTPYRFAVYLSNADGSEKASIEMDRDWFCLCASGPEGWRTSAFFTNVQTERDYHMRLVLGTDGSVKASVYDEGFMPLAERAETGLALGPREVAYAGFAAWADDEFSPASDYSVTYVRLAPTP